MAAGNKPSLKGSLQHLHCGRHGSLEICRRKILSTYVFVARFMT